ncbi:MAG TPA: helix-turn-helix transcriptional regulator [Chitinophagaceae bacterium]|nr:helix-turn-helix transcriptional regulator [Chitinophagaceae bacterium]
MSQKNKLGNRIIDLRKAKNWSQSDLAAKVGVSYAQIGRYETKDAQPPAAVLKKIADALDTTLIFYSMVIQKIKQTHLCRMQK